MVCQWKKYREVRRRHIKLNITTSNIRLDSSIEKPERGINTRINIP
jgi:hypothetical protein